MTTEEHRKLDAQVAETVLGWEGIETGDGMMDYVGRDPKRQGRYWLLHPSTRIADAWKVVEAMRERGYTCATKVYRGRAEIEGGAGDCRADFGDFYGTAESMPLAICRAALEAIRSEETEEA